MILSDAFADLILDFSVEEVFAPEPGMVEGEYCTIPITERQQIIFTRRRSMGRPDLDEYAYRYTPNLYGLMQTFDSISLEKSGIVSVQRRPLSLTGQGVILAFVDTGIDYRSEAFRRSDGSSRILALWDQTVQTGTPPEGYIYGSEFSREDIDRALQLEDPYSLVPSRDENGHGTAMASVAAGSVLDGGSTFRGAAPEADIVVVKLKECKPYLRDYYLISDAPAYSETDLMLGVKYVEDFLVSLERPVVLCLGIGTNWGDHSGSSPFARYLSSLATQRSMVILACGGNEGNVGHHYRGRLTAGNAEAGRGTGENLSGSPGGNGQGSATLASDYRDVEIRVAEGSRGFFLEFWGNILDIYEVEIRSPGGETAPDVDLGLGQSITHRFVYERTEISFYNVLVESDTGEQLIIMRFVQPTAGIWRIRVTGVGNVRNGTFHMWLPITEFLTSETYFLEGTPDVTLTEPSNAVNVITVSTYNDENDSFYIASGRGFTRSGRVKPDIAAPGVNVSAIRGDVTGSSIAAAVAAGAVAQFMQWAVVEENRPFVTSLDVRNYLIRGATRAEDVTYPSRMWGYGRLNIEGTFDAIAGV